MYMYTVQQGALGSSISVISSGLQISTQISSLYEIRKTKDEDSPCQRYRVAQTLLHQPKQQQTDFPTHHLLSSTLSMPRASHRSQTQRTSTLIYPQKAPIPHLDCTKDPRPRAQKRKADIIRAVSMLAHPLPKNLPYFHSLLARLIFRLRLSSIQRLRFRL